MFAGVARKYGGSRFIAVYNGSILFIPNSHPITIDFRVAVGFYCLGALDLIGLLDKKVSEADREAWRNWIWAQQVSRPTTRTFPLGYLTFEH